MRSRLACGGRGRCADPRLACRTSAGTVGWSRENRPPDHRTIEEMQEFCKAAVAAAHADPSALRLHVPQDMRVAEIPLADGRKVYDVLVSSAG